MADNNSIVVDIDLNVESKNFVKKVTFAATESGKAIEKELSGAIVDAEKNLKDFAELQKKVLSNDIDVSEPIYKQSRALAELSSKFIDLNNTVQTTGNKRTKALTDEYKNLLEMERQAQAAVSEGWSNHKAKYSETLNLIEKVREREANASIIEENIKEENRLNETLKVRNELLKDARAEEHKLSNAWNKVLAEARKEYIAEKGYGNDRYLTEADNKAILKRADFGDLTKQMDAAKKETEKWAKRVGEIKEKIDQIAYGTKYVAEAENAANKLASAGLKTEEDYVALEQQRVQSLAEIYNKESELRDIRQQIQEIDMSGTKTKSVGVSEDQAAKLRKAATDMMMFAQSTDEAEQETRQLRDRFGELIDKFKSLEITTKRTRRATNGFFDDTKKGVKHALRNIMRYGLGVRSLYFLFRRLRAATKEAFKIMAQVIPEVNTQVSRLITAFNSVKASLATMIQPLLVWIVPAFERLAAAAKRAMEYVAKVFAVLTGQGYIYKANAAMVDYADSLDSASKSAKTLKDNLQGFDELNVINSDKGGADKGGGLFSTDTINYEKEMVDENEFQWVLKVKEMFLKLRDVIQYIGDKLDEWKISEKLKSAFTWLIEHADELKDVVIAIGAGILAWKIASAFTSHLLTLVGIFLLVGGAIEFALSYWDAWKNGLSDNNVTKLVLSTIAMMSGLALIFGTTGASIGLLITGIAMLVLAIKDIIKTGTLSYNTCKLIVAGILAIGAALTLLTGSLIPIVIAGVTALVVTIVTLIINNWDKIKSAFQRLGDWFKSQWEKWTAFIQKVFDNVTNLFNKIISKWTKLWEDGFWGGIKNIINKIIGGIEFMINKIIDGINFISEKLNKISFDIPDWVPVIGGQTFGFQLNELPHISINKLAKGAVIPPNKEFLAMLGDQKQGTNVEAPLSTIEDAVRNVLSEMQLNLNLNVQGDPSRMFTVMQRESASFSKRTGRPAFT